MSNIYQAGIRVASDTKQARVDVEKLRKNLHDLQDEAKETSGAFSALEKSTKKASDKVNQLSAAQLKALKMKKQLNIAATQVGYQVQDMAVQFQMGTNALVILGQQGSQLASLLGPAGALFGAVIAIGSAIGMSLAPSLFKTEDAIKDVNDALGRFNDLTDDVSGIVRFNDKIREMAKVSKNAAEAYKELTLESAKFAVSKAQSGMLKLLGLDQDTLDMVTTTQLDRLRYGKNDRVIRYSVPSYEETLSRQSANAREAMEEAMNVIGAKLGLKAGEISPFSSERNPDRFERFGKSLLNLGIGDITEDDVEEVLGHLRKAFKRAGAAADEETLKMREGLLKHFTELKQAVAKISSGLAEDYDIDFWENFWDDRIREGEAMARQFETDKKRRRSEAEAEARAKEAAFNAISSKLDADIAKAKRIREKEAKDLAREKRARSAVVDSLRREIELSKQSARQRFILQNIQSHTVKLSAMSLKHRQEEIDLIKKEAGALFDRKKAQEEIDEYIGIIADELDRIEKEKQKVKNLFIEPLGEGFTSLVEGSEDAFSDIEKSFVRMARSLGSEWVWEPVKKQLNNLFTAHGNFNFDTLLKEFTSFEDEVSLFKSGMSGLAIGQAITGATGGNQANSAIGSSLGGIAGGAFASSAAGSAALAKMFSIAGSAVPGVGTLIGAALGGVVGGLFGKDKPKKPKFQLASNLRVDPSQIDYLGRYQGLDYQSGIVQRGAFGTVGFEEGATRKINSQQLNDMAKAITAVDDAIAGFLTPQEQNRISDALVNFTSQSTKDMTELGFFEVVKERLGFISEEISGSFGSAVRIISDTSDSLEEFSQRLDAIKVLGPVMAELFGVSELGTDFASQAVGGADNLGRLIDSFVDNFMSPEEGILSKINVLQDELRKQLGKLGMRSGESVVNALKNNPTRRVGELLEAADVYAKIIDLEEELVRVREQETEAVKDLSRAIALNDSLAMQLALNGMEGVKRQLAELQFEYSASAKEAQEAGASIALLTAVYANKRTAIIEEAEKQITESFEKILDIADNVRKSIDSAIVDVLRSGGNFDEVGHQKGIIQSIIDEFVSTPDIEKRISLVEEGKHAVLARYYAEREAIQQTQEDAENLYKAQQKALDNLKEIADGFLLSDISPLTSKQRFTEATSQFDSLLAAARGGDLDAINNLGGAAQNLLSEGSDRFSTASQVYADLFNRVQEDLRGLNISQTQLPLHPTEAAIQKELLSVQEQAVSELNFLKRVLDDLEIAAGNERTQQIRELHEITIANDNARTDRTIEAIHSINSGSVTSPPSSPAPTTSPATTNPFGYGDTRDIGNNQQVVMTALGPVVQEVSRMNRKLEEQTDAIHRAITKAFISRVAGAS